MLEFDDTLKILPYEEHYALDFLRLNLEWLESFNLLEDADAKHLNSPRESIIDKGGQIFFAVRGSTVLGTCAAIRHSSESVEIAKLAVIQLAQRRGIGRLLVQAVIEYAGSLGAKKVLLVSNTRLKLALRLYESMGFIHNPLPKKPIYASANVYMELVF